MSFTRNLKWINAVIWLRKWGLSDCQAAHSSELETQSSLVHKPVMWQKDFEAVEELFGVGRGVKGLQIQPEAIHWIASARKFQPFLPMVLGMWKEECNVSPWTITMPLHTYGRAKDMSRNGASPPKWQIVAGNQTIECLQLYCSFFFPDRNSFHCPNALSTNGEDKCLTSLESNCFRFSCMVWRALRLNLHVDAEMMNVGIKQAWCYQMYHLDWSCNKNIQYQWGYEMSFRRRRDIEC